MKNICICGPYPEPVGGVSIHIRRLSEVVRFEYVVKVVDESPIIKSEIFNVRSLNFIRYISIIFRSDIVHVNSSVVIFRFLHVFFSKLLFKKVIVTVHSYRPVNSFYNVLNEFCFKKSDCNVVVSKEISEAFNFPHRIIPAFIKPTSSDFHISNLFFNAVDYVKKSGKLLIVSSASRLDFSNGKEIYGFRDLIFLLKDPDVNKKYSLILNVSSLAGCKNIFNEYIELIENEGLSQTVFIFNEKLNFPALLSVSDVHIRATSTDGDALSVRESLLLNVKTIASDCVQRPKGTILYKDGNIISLKQALLNGQSSEVCDTVSFENDILDIYRQLIWKLNDK